MEYFMQQNDKGDLLWLNLATKRPEYANKEYAERRGYVPLYVKVTGEVTEGKIFEDD